MFTYLGTSKIRRLFSLTIAILFTFNSLSWAVPIEQDALRPLSTGQKQAKDADGFARSLAAERIRHRLNVIGDDITSMERRLLAAPDVPHYSGWAAGGKPLVAALIKEKGLAGLFAELLIGRLVGIAHQIENSELKLDYETIENIGISLGVLVQEAPEALPKIDNLLNRVYARLKEVLQKEPELRRDAYTNKATHLTALLCALLARYERSGLFVREVPEAIFEIIKDGREIEVSSWLRAQPRQRAINAVKEIGPAAVPGLDKLFSEGGYSLRSSVISICEEMGPAGIPVLVKALDDDEVAYRAVHALLYSGEQSQRIAYIYSPAIPLRLKALAAGYGVAMTYSIDKDKKSDLRAKQSDTDLLLRKIEALKEKSAMSYLTELTGNEQKDIRIRAQAAFLLGETGKRASSEVPALIRLLDRIKEPLKRQIALAIPKIVKGRLAEESPSGPAQKSSSAGASSRFATIRKTFRKWPKLLANNPFYTQRQAARAYSAKDTEVIGEVVTVSNRIEDAAEKGLAYDLLLQQLKDQYEISGKTKEAITAEGIRLMAERIGRGCERLLFAADIAEDAVLVLIRVTDPRAEVNGSIAGVVIDKPVKDMIQTRPVVAINNETGLNVVFARAVSTKNEIAACGEFIRRTPLAPKASSAGEMKIRVDDFIFTCADREAKQEILLDLSKLAMARLRNAMPDLMKSDSIITELDRQPRQEMRLGDKDLSLLLPALKISLFGFNYIVFVKIGEGEFLPLLVRRLPGVPYQIDIITEITQGNIEGLITIAKKERRSNARHLVLAALDRYAKRQRRQSGDQAVRGRFFIETVALTKILLKSRGLLPIKVNSLIRGLERLSMKADKKKGYMVLSRELIEGAFAVITLSACVRLPGPDSAYLVLVKPDEKGFMDIPILIRIRDRHTVEGAIANLTPRQALEISRVSSVSVDEARALETFAEQLREKEQKSSSAGLADSAKLSNMDLKRGLYLEAYEKLESLRRGIGEKINEFLPFPAKNEAIQWEDIIAVINEKDLDRIILTIGPFIYEEKKLFLLLVRDSYSYKIIAISLKDLSYLILKIIDKSGFEKTILALMTELEHKQRDDSAAGKQLEGFVVTRPIWDSAVESQTTKSSSAGIKIMDFAVVKIMTTKTMGDYLAGEGVEMSEDLCQRARYFEEEINKLLGTKLGVSAKELQGYIVSVLEEYESWKKIFIPIGIILYKDTGLVLMLINDRTKSKYRLIGVGTRDIPYLHCIFYDLFINDKAMLEAIITQAIDSGRIAGEAVPGCADYLRGIREGLDEVRIETETKSLAILPRSDIYVRMMEEDQPELLQELLAISSYIKDHPTAAKAKILYNAARALNKERLKKVDPKTMKNMGLLKEDKIGSIWRIKALGSGVEFIISGSSSIPNPAQIREATGRDVAISYENKIAVVRREIPVSVSAAKEFLLEQRSFEAISQSA